MKHEVTGQTVIKAPLAEVWALDADPRNWPLYVKSVASVEAPPDGRFDTGARFAVEYGVPGMKFPGNLEVLACEPKRRFRFIARGRSADVVQTNEFTEIDARQTRVSWTLQLSSHEGVLARAIGLAMKLEMSPRSVQRDLDKLRELCERQQRHT